MESYRVISKRAIVIGVGLLFVVVGIGAGLYWYVNHNGNTNDETVVTTDSRLTGRVVYRERVSLPPGSSVLVQLLDVTDEGLEPLLIAEQTIITRGENVPIEFAVPYNQSQIMSDRRYALEASILADGGLYFLTPELTPVLTANNPSESVDLLLTRDGVPTIVGADGEVAPVSLPGTVWQWVRTENDPFAPQTPLTAPVGKPFILNVREGGTFNSTTDCNRIAGGYVINGQSLSFGSIQMTEMACPDSLDATYAAALGRVESFTLSETELRLNLQNNSGVMIFAKEILSDSEITTPEAPATTTSESVGNDPDESDQVMCTMDVMTCPDGTFVGRVAPGCAFAPCPGV